MVDIEETEQFFLEARVESCNPSAWIPLTGFPGYRIFSFHREKLRYVDVATEKGGLRAGLVGIWVNDRHIWYMVYHVSREVQHSQLLPFLKDSSRENRVQGKFPGGKSFSFEKRGLGYSRHPGTQTDSFSRFDAEEKVVLENYGELFSQTLHGKLVSSWIRTVTAGVIAPAYALFVPLGNPSPAVPFLETTPLVQLLLSPH